MYHKHHTNETKLKIRNSQLGKKFTNETIEKLKNRSKGSNNGMYKKGYLISGDKNGMYHKGHLLSGENYFLNKLSSEERIEWIENNLKGENHFLNKMSDEQRKQWIKENKCGENSPRAKTYEVFNKETNETKVVKCLKSFCEKNNLSVRIMTNIVKGKRKDKYYDNWTLKEIKEVES